MAKNPIQQRRQRYFQLSAQIAQIDNERLRSLLGASESGVSWGSNQTVDLGNARVFVKRIPVTAIEYENMLSTKNLFHLPPHYHYGVGSVGLGVFRELVAHIKTTHWVLDGQIETFPLMYHYRVVPFSGEQKEVESEPLQRYVDYWGGNENIGRYMRERAGAGHELLLFLEYIPHVLHPWLKANLGRVHTVLDDLYATVDFLRKHGIIHFDAHFYNILTDGERPYLTDFGLVLDKSFDLLEDEAAFFRANTHYDYGEILGCIGGVIYEIFEALPESDQRTIGAKYGMAEGMHETEKRAVFLNHIEEIHADGIMKVDQRAVACVVRYRSIIALIVAFFTDMSSNDRKDTKFRNAQLKRLLKASRPSHLPADGSS